jgi:hypothetical protein
MFEKSLLEVDLLCRDLRYVESASLSIPDLLDWRIAFPTSDLGRATALGLAVHLVLVIAPHVD